MEVSRGIRPGKAEAVAVSLNSNWSMPKLRLKTYSPRLRALIAAAASPKKIAKRRYKGFSDFNNSRLAPARAKHRAVLALMIGKPGNTVDRETIWKIQPQRTYSPAAKAA